MGQGIVTRARARHTLIIFSVYFFFVACGKQTGTTGSDDEDLFGSDGQGTVTSIGGASGAVSQAGAGNDTSGMAWNTNGTATTTDDGWVANAKDLNASTSAGEGLPSFSSLLKDVAKKAKPGFGIPDVILGAIEKMPGGKEYLKELLCDDVQTITDAKDAAFLAALYQMVYGRAATEQEIAEGQRTLSSFGDSGRRSLASTVVESAEGVAQTVETVYQKLLKRAAEAAGQTYWQNVHRTGRDNSGKKGTEEVTAGVAASQEYFSRAGQRFGVDGVADFKSFLRAVYLDLLGRAVDGTGWTYFTGVYEGAYAQYKAQGMPEDWATVHARLQVTRQITQSTEYCSAQVRGYYRSLLGREGEEAGVNGWTGVCQNANTDLDDVRAGFFSSPEYRDHQGAKESGKLILKVCTGG